MKLLYICLAWLSCILRQWDLFLYLYRFPRLHNHQNTQLKSHILSYHQLEYHLATLFLDLRQIKLTFLLHPPQQRTPDDHHEHLIHI